MENYNNEQSIQLFDDKSNNPTAGNEREDPQKMPGIPLPNDPNMPAKPDENHDPTKITPGGNDPEKNDPPRIAEPSNK